MNVVAPDAVYLALLGFAVLLMFTACSNETSGQPSAATPPGDSAKNVALSVRAAPAQFNAAERRQLLALARRALEASVRSGELPDLDVTGLPPLSALPRGCFVTLTKQGRLRGCIGNVLPRVPLCQAIMENARAAALNDYRFERVQPGELKDLEIQISVLTEPKPLTFASPDELLAQLRPNQDGVVLRIGSQAATFLPQVWEKLPDKVAFLNHLSQKAGCAQSVWREPGIMVEVYQVEAFDDGTSSQT